MAYREACRHANKATIDSRRKYYRASKRTPLKRDEETAKWNEMNKGMKWSWFKVLVKVEQINEYLFSDTVQSQWKQKVAMMK